MPITLPTNHQSNTQGFSLIEIIVSLAVFAVVVTTATGALLGLLANNQKLQAEQAIMTNLSFALDSMTREIRTGYNYYCATSDSATGLFATGVTTGHESLGENLQDCLDAQSNGNNFRGVSFYEGGSSITGTSRRIMYFFDRSAGRLLRRVGNAAPISIISSSLRLEEVDIRVTGTAKLTGGGNDTNQPTVTISIVATEVGNTDKKYRIQTTVTQRIIDL